ncbi:MAG TPA: FAD-dependent oxidoreductase [Ktedonobacterales bacterium]|nr:FAD-dependent oxidoreductase [Ktedonobacterales bacterium]
MRSWAQAPVATDGSYASVSATPRPYAPWHEHIGDDVREALGLPNLATVPSEVVDVVVIGAGVAGLSAACAARAAGAGVLVLEGQSQIGLGATGRNAGILSAGINMGLADLDPGEPDARMFPATTRLLRDLAEETKRPGALVAATLTGALTLAETRSAARHLDREARARRAAGLRAELWSAAEVAEATGGRLDARSVVEALWLPDEGRLQPLTLLAHLAAQARRAGVHFAGNAPVAEWVETKGRQVGRHWRVKLASGAAIATRGLILATGPTTRPSARIYALTFAIDLPASFPLFWDAAPYTYADYRPGGGFLVVSGGRYGRAGATKRDVIYHTRLAAGTRHWLPELAAREPTHAWAVDLAVDADMRPRLSAIGERAPGLSVEGLGALGVLPGMLLGREAGERVARRLGGS